MSHTTSSPETTTKGNNDKPVKWEDVKRARNRINSQRTRERERAHIESLEAERNRLWISNDALKYQNSHFREAIRLIHELQDPRQQLRGRGASPGKASRPTPTPTPASFVASRAADISDHDRALYAAGLNIGLGTGLSSVHVGPSSLDRTSLLAQRQAALEMHLQHQRAGLGSHMTLPQIPHSRFMINRPSLLDQGMGAILPADLLELRARQQRFQNLGGTDITLAYPTGVPSSFSVNDPSLFVRDERKQNDQSESSKRQRFGY
jgi:hypothetical protein